MVFALSAVAVIDSYVRIAIVAVAAGVAVLGLLLLVSRGVSGRAKLAAVLTAVVVAGGMYGAAVLAGGASSSTEERAKGLSDPLADQSLKIRWKTWTRSVDKIQAEPLGTGLGTVGHATQEGRRESFTDNTYLKVFQEQGILGGLLFTLGIIGTAVLIGRRLAQDARPTTRSPSRRWPRSSPSSSSASWASTSSRPARRSPGRCSAWRCGAPTASRGRRAARGREATIVAPDRHAGAVGAATAAVGARWRALGRGERLLLGLLVAVLALVPALVTGQRSSSYRSPVVLAVVSPPTAGAPYPVALVRLQVNSRLVQGLIAARALAAALRRPPVRRAVGGGAPWDGWVDRPDGPRLPTRRPPAGSPIRSPRDSRTSRAWPPRAGRRCAASWRSSIVRCVRRG